MCVADVLKRELRRKRGLSDEAGAQKSEQELEALVAVMKRLRQVYPVLGEQWMRFPAQVSAAHHMALVKGLWVNNVQNR